MSVELEYEDEFEAAWEADKKAMPWWMRAFRRVFEGSEDYLKIVAYRWWCTGRNAGLELLEREGEQ